jgi:formamidopyrimidine-DNA glycosylase
MPELPDVELFKRRLDRAALGRRIERVVVGDPRILGDLAAADLVARLEGNRLQRSHRHGKHLLVGLTAGGWLSLHFGMTGALVLFDDLADEPAYDRVRLDFAGGGHLGYVNRRMLGRVGLTDGIDDFIRAEGLGPDALDPNLDQTAFAAALGNRRRDIKSVLMDQALLAGIGNLYADEILFQARVHPKTPVAALDDTRRAQLHRQMRTVLETAIEQGAGAEQEVERLPTGYLLPHRQPDGPCPRCSGSLTAIKVGGRTTILCPACQPLS